MNTSLLTGSVITREHLQPVTWKLRMDHPKWFELPGLPGWKLVNPAYYHVIEGFGPSIEQKDLFADLLGDGSFCMQTNYMVFVVPEAEGFDIFMDIPINDRAATFIANLRHLTCQPALRLPPGGSGGSNAPSVLRMPDRITFGPDPYDRSEWYITPFTIATAITPEVVLKASQAGDTKLGETWDVTFVDGLERYLESDMRTALLYLTMTMEIAAATSLDRWIDEAKANPAGFPHLRIKEVSLAGGATTFKDPVYDYLKKADNFASLLHERPLYVAQKSLLYDNENLYRRARKLYGTRNSLVHSGVIPESGNNEYYTFSPDDMREAIQVAIDVVKWFGGGDTYVVPSGELIRTEIIFSPTG